MIYKKKITAQLGWLRPVERREPLMRLTCLVEEGWEEASQFGYYIRWVGKFRCEAIQRDGTISVYASRNLIIPGLASDMIAEAFTVENKGDMKTGTRTGRYYHPGLEGALDVFAVLDLYLVPPSKARASETGYEYEVQSVVTSAQEDIFARLTHEIPEFMPPPSLTVSEALSVAQAEGPVEGPAGMQVEGPAEGPAASAKGKRQK